MSKSPSRAAHKALVARVPLAWPTLVLSIGVTALWLTSTTLALLGTIPSAVALALNVIAAFGAFTPMHDASHRSVSASRGVNEAVGRLSSLLLLAPFPAFRWVHLEHHKHTNEPDADPDYWSGKGPGWMLPLRWLTQDLHYYVLYFEALDRRPHRERVEVLGSLALFYGAAIALAAAGWLGPVVLLWLIPARIATAMLAFSFDYLPHRPHRITSKQDRYRATHILADRWLTPLFLYQNYHLIHHLYPGVPFYRYARVWRAEERALIAKGAAVKRLFRSSSRTRSPQEA